MNMKSSVQPFRKMYWLALPTAIILFAVGFLFVQGQEDNATIDREVDKINKEIKARRQKSEEIQKKQEEYAKALAEKKNEKATLVDQLGVLDNRIAATMLEIERLQVEIDETTLEMKKTTIEITNKEEEIKREKDHVGTVLKLLYKRDRANALEVLLLNDSFSEFMNQVKYLEDVNQELADSLEDLRKLHDDLQAKKSALEVKNKKLAELKKGLDDKRVSLESEKEDKNFLVVQTEESEQQFQRLIAQAKQEQSAAAAEVVQLEQLMREKLSKKQQQKLEQNPAGMIWPVSKNTITTYFHDPDYPFRYIFEHPAVDIRAKQGTTMRAAASGYVARAKDAGMGYSYIMIVHGNNLATVYGHVSKIMVEEDQYVVQGQPIGLSGGMPGTPGAGKLTTGPHLHFEVRLNGIPVNPLEYLP
ncbi:peptidoglycan DD-metalloendopeptidase family protein [Candidatus Falkowbacteria bacterium]|nr:peptidoglycan DD-metalloendopeptidase family protein [Candidatus Falkowbacteria bacterium]